MQIRQEEYRKSLENQIKYQQDQYIGILDSHKGQDKQFVDLQWKKEQDKIKREESEVIQKKYQAIEMAKETLQKAQIKKKQVETVNQTENEGIRHQLMQAEVYELKRLETQRAIK